MTRKLHIRSTHHPVDPNTFGDFLRKLERRIEEYWADKPAPPAPPPDPWENYKPGTLIAAEKDVRLWALIEELELGLCGGHEKCRQAWCRRARRCATIERLRPEMEKSVFAMVVLCPIAAAGGTPPFPFTMSKPAGDGPFPAVVILHDCSGVGPRSSGMPWRWSSELTQRGYVTVWPDSFTPRGRPKGVCAEAVPPRISFEQRAGDAYAALVYLASLSFVDARRIAMMGGINLHCRGPNVIACDAAFSKGDELGWFEHGSTMIVFAPAGFTLSPGIEEGAVIRMGQPLMRLLREPHPSSRTERCERLREHCSDPGSCGRSTRSTRSRIASPAARLPG